MKQSLVIAVLATVLLTKPVHAQQISKEELLFLTPEWKGERFDDGRPRVPDDILERMKQVTLEEAWAVLRNNRFNFQYEGDWQTLDPDAVLVGRAVTATFMPGRPDIHAQYDLRGREDKRSGSQNSWVVDMLQPGDVPETFADISAISRDLGFEPSTRIETGAANFVNWFRDYHA